MPRIGTVSLHSPVVMAPMAGMTDTAFRRLVKRQGGCGLVVTEMVSSEGLVRGIDRTLEYAEYRRRASGLHSNLRRRSIKDGRRCADR
ncbi:MAG: tRNA-dihydrouridine synthase [Acidobacteria bacterium]|nr:tRNA-dihydrouridine synthase [Acidobacteriota bacterium]